MGNLSLQQHIWYQQHFSEQAYTNIHCVSSAVKNLNRAILCPLRRGDNYEFRLCT